MTGCNKINTGNLSFLPRSFLRLRLREAKGFPKPIEKPGQDPYDGEAIKLDNKNN